MKEKFRYIPKEERKRILLLADDIRLHSGIATMSKEIVIGTAHHFNWVNLGAAVKHPDQGKRFDLSPETNKMTGLTDSDVIVIPNTGYGTQLQVRELIAQYNPDAILAFTDPRYWVWLFEMEREIRNKIPIFYLNIWDNYPTPLYNKAYYQSCDLLMAISKQTKLINELTLEDEAASKVIKYVPHGINPEHFFPIRESDPDSIEKLEAFKQTIFKGVDYKYVVFFNSRNVQRKRPGDVILAYRNFCELIGKEKAKECVMIMHTAPKDSNGTDLYAVREAVCDPEYVNVLFSTDKLETAQLNLLYNLADVTMLISSNEGWGLSLTESMMAGTMIIGNVTGGMQDQMRFVDGDGEWFTPSPEVPSNHRKTYTQHGEWVLPVFPSNISLAGSVGTPYIYDDRCDVDDVAEALLECYNMSKEERDRKGLAGRTWALSDEARMSSVGMCQNVIESCDEAFEKFTPRSTYDLIKIEPLPRKQVQHKLNKY